MTLRIVWVQDAPGAAAVFADDHLVRVSACGRFRIAPEWAPAGRSWRLTIDGVMRAERFATRGEAKNAARDAAGQGARR